MDDFISRAAAIKEIMEDAGCDFCGLKIAGCCLSCSAGKKIIRIRQMPAADVRPVVRGQWEPCPILDDARDKFYKCSVCRVVTSVPHGQNIIERKPFCNCGANMNQREERKKECAE